MDPGFDPKHLRSLLSVANALDPTGWMAWVYREWLHWNRKCFDLRLPIPNIIRTLTPNGDSMGHYGGGWNEIALHPSTWDPQFAGVKLDKTWGYDRDFAPFCKNLRYASHVLLHEMGHQAEHRLWPELQKSPSTHRSPSWCHTVNHILQRADLPGVAPNLLVPAQIKQLWAKPEQYRKAVYLGIWEETGNESRRETKKKEVRICIRVPVDANGDIMWLPADQMVGLDDLEHFPHTLIRGDYYRAEVEPEDRSDWADRLLRRC